MRFKPPKTEKGERIQVRSNPDAQLQLQPPTFSLRYLNKDYCLSKCTKEEKAAFADKLHKLSQLSWQEIMQADRHGLGFEKIAHSAIKTSIPAHLGEDVNIIAFRFAGKAPMVGYRDQATFYVIWLDRDFTLYRHG
jgi:hypothetical protein